MPRRVKNPLKGTNDFLVTSTPNGKRLQVILNYLVWYVLNHDTWSVSCQLLCALL